MIIFIDDRPIRVISQKKAKALTTTEFDRLIDAQLEAVRPELLKGHILIVNVIAPTITRLFAILKEDKLPDFQSITIVSENKEFTEEQIKNQYKVIKAGGGIVKNNKNEILLMFRNKKWDLPKGKLEKEETSEIGALREVEEECNVKIALGEKVCTTYHTYTQKNEFILKKTKWFSMKLIDDSKMKPQTEEGIEKLEWMNPKEVHLAMIKSYSSIRYVIGRYYDLGD
jgi:8-oxo-(d)GTP phosphatase